MTKPDLIPSFSGAFGKELARPVYIRPGRAFHVGSAMPRLNQRGLYETLLD
jgi:hypothetical protein